MKLKLEAFVKGRKTLLLFIFFIPLLSTFRAEAQLGVVDQNARTKPTLVVLGIYHMGNPGNNIVNPKVADISSRERQQQIVELVQRLKRFDATKIMLECDSDADASTNDAYARYLAGTYRLSKNETNQIGFRLAKEMGHKKVYCVDWSDFWDDPAINYEKYASKDAEMDAFLKTIYLKLKKDKNAEYEKLLPLTITEQLVRVNQPAQIEKDHKFYFDLIRIGRGKEYIGAGYVSWWYRRNLVILDNIIRNTTTSTDRILVVYGVGHAKLLTQFAKESDFYTVKTPLEYLRYSK